MWPIALMRFGHTLYSTHPSKTPLVMLKKILIAIIVIAGAALDMMAQKNADILPVPPRLISLRFRSAPTM